MNSQINRTIRHLLNELEITIKKEDQALFNRLRKIILDEMNELRRDITNESLNSEINERN